VLAVLVGLAAGGGCAMPDLPEPALPVPDRPTVVEEHSTTQAPGSPLTSDQQPPAAPSAPADAD
jgi:hypothetical protein